MQLWAYFGPWEAETCKQFVAFIPAFPIFGVIASHVILLIQCHAVWNRNKLVLICLIPLIVAETAIMSVSSFTQIGREAGASVQDTYGLMFCSSAVPLPTATGPCLPRALSAFCILYFVS